MIVYKTTNQISIKLMSTLGLLIIWPSCIVSAESAGMTLGLSSVLRLAWKSPRRNERSSEGGKGWTAWDLPQSIGDIIYMIYIYIWILFLRWIDIDCFRTPTLDVRKCHISTPTFFHFVFCGCQKTCVTYDHPWMFGLALYSLYGLVISREVRKSPIVQPTEASTNSPLPFRNQTVLCPLQATTMKSPLYEMPIRSNKRNSEYYIYNIVNQICWYSPLVNFCWFKNVNILTYWPFQGNVIKLYIISSHPSSIHHTPHLTWPWQLLRLFVEAFEKAVSEMGLPHERCEKAVEQCQVRLPRQSKDGNSSNKNDDL